MDLEKLKQALLTSTPEERHSAVVALGKYDILKFFDSLPWLKDAADWTAWRAFLAASHGLPLTEKERAIFETATGRRTPPKKQAREVWMVCGRRARKSAVAATLGCFTAVYKDHRSYLAPGERATIPILARTKADARQIRDYVVAALTSSPELSHLLEGEPTAEEIRLKTRCDFAIRAATITSVRSRTVPLFIGDEIAFWTTDDAANPDREILASVLPAQLLVPNPMVVGLSSPYARRGLLWDRYDEFFGKEDSDAFVWKAPTLLMHDTPEIQAVVEAEYIKDHISAAAEYGAEFRTDVVAFVGEAEVDAVTGDHEFLPPVPGTKYVAWVDPSGGSVDSFALAIAHFDHGVILDLVKEWPAPFDPSEIVVEAAEIIREYNCTRVGGDKYGGKIFEALFRRLSVQYHGSDKSRSDIYGSLLPLINGKLITFCKSETLKDQLLSLDRKVTGQGREIIDHPKGSHDDVANAAAGAVVLADTLRWPFKEAPKEFGSTEEIFLDRLWKPITKARKGNKSKEWVNPYAIRYGGR